MPVPFLNPDTPPFVRPMICSPTRLPADTLIRPGYCCNLGHRDALQTWRNRDADTIKTPAQGVGSILATTRGQTGKGRDVPKADTTRPQQSGMG